MPVGLTFPRRAKQLVAKDKATWFNDEHTAILLSAAKPEIQDKTEGADIMEKAKAAIEVEATTELATPKKSIIKDAYRDTESKVLASSPIEIIKKSKKRTRELHNAFSLVLWAGAALIYFVSNYFLGNSFKLSTDLSLLSPTWLIFVVASIIECSAEIFFCRKELAVLIENIDLRQINPANKTEDIDLHSYKNQLTRKIRIMSSAAVWLPVTLCYFLTGYIYNAWLTAWVLFVLAAFSELVRNFITKLKSNAS
jgi:TRAP-type C4-dicarboxylate transport system permease small subunit